jgi:hypothetical protein
MMLPVPPEMEDPEEMTTLPLVPVPIVLSLEIDTDPVKPSMEPPLMMLISPPV